MLVVDAMEPGAMKVVGMLRTGVVVGFVEVIWLAVPVTDVTVPLPVPQVGQVIFGVVPPELTITPDPVTAVTVPVPQAAAAF
jgi:hypothetical protein